MLGLSVILGGLIGYLFGVAKDRSGSIAAKRMEAMTNLHDKVVEIETLELSDGETNTLMVPIHATRSQRTENLSDAEFSHLQKVQESRLEQYREERKARLWLSRKTVDLVSSYLLLMMHCQSWKDNGQGSLLEDSWFLELLGSIFEDPSTVLKDDKVVKRRDDDGEPWLLNCIRLSDRCLEVIQNRMRIEVDPFPRIRAFCQKCLAFLQ